MDPKGINPPRVIFDELGDYCGLNGMDWGPDGRLYIVPRNATRAARFDPATETWEAFGDAFPEGGHKWIGAAVSSFDNCIYSFPAQCSVVSRVLQIDPSKGTALMVGESILEQDIGATQWAYHDVVMAADGCMYGIPSNGTSGLKFDPRMKQLSTFGQVEAGGDKYWSGILGPAGRFIFCIPSRAARVLCIDTKTQTCELIGDSFQRTMMGKWYGGNFGGDGAIYCIPFYYERVLRIDPLTKTTSFFGPVLQGKGEWLGGAAGADGCVYGMPNNSKLVLRIDPFAGTVSTVGSPIPTELKFKFLGGVLGPRGSVALAAAGRAELERPPRSCPS